MVCRGSPWSPPGGWACPVAWVAPGRPVGVSVVLGCGGGRSRQGPQLFLQGRGNHQVPPGLSLTLGHAGLSFGGDVLWGSQRSLTP